MTGIENSINLEAEASIDTNLILNDIFLNNKNVNYRDFIQLILKTEDEDIKVFFSELFNLGNIN